MKKITFKHLELLNFCGTREASYDFGENVNVISGTNGIGKSTLASALTYVLFGTDIKGNTLDIKTYDKEHKIIPEIEHSATLVLLVDGEEITFKRTLTDSWNNGVVKNTYKYSVNGDITTAKDFKKVVDEICSEITFRLASSATKFLSMPWADQRKFLETLIPDIKPETVTSGDSIYDFVLEAIQKQSIDDFVHHIKYNRAEVQKQLDKIPTRLQELDKALPEQLDWTALSNTLEEKKNEAAELTEEIIAVNNGGAEQVRKDSIRNKIEFATKRKDNMVKSARNQANEEITKHESDMLTASKAYHEANSIVEDLKAKMRGLTQTEVHVKSQIEECRKDVKELNNRMTELDERTWEWNDDDSFCPHCGQAYPISKLSSMKELSRNNFNENIASAKKKLQEKFGKLQEEYTNAKKVLEDTQLSFSETTNAISSASKQLKDTESNFEKVKQETPRSYTTILEEKDEYRGVCQEIANLEAELNTTVSPSSDNVEMINELSKKKDALDKEIEVLNEQVSQKASYERITKLIEDANLDKENFQNQLDKLDEQLDIASEYYQRSCEVLEEEVNKHFSFVKWSMFQTTLDGAKKPYCECYHDGVPFSHLNWAATINAGIDIAYTIGRFYDVSVPMIIDNCESNLNPIYQGGQQIRLRVSEDKELKFEYAD